MRQVYRLNLFKSQPRHERDMLRHFGHLLAQPQGIVLLISRVRIQLHQSICGRRNHQRAHLDVLPVQQNFPLTLLCACVVSAADAADESDPMLISESDQGTRQTHLKIVKPE